MALVGRDRHYARMRRQYTGKQRSQLVELVTGGHATVHEAAARLGVVPATAYYWLERGKAEERGTRSRRGGRRVADQGTATTFVRLIPGAAVPATIAVRIGGAEVQVREGFDGGLLRAVVMALQEGAP
jgi:transposase-like protein